MTAPCGPASRVDAAGHLDDLVSKLLGIAADHGSGLAEPELASLLPADAGLDPGTLHAWLLARPSLARLANGWVYEPGRHLSADPGRRARADGFEQIARRLWAGPLRGALPWVRCVGITGSTAYGAPGDDDDLDFLVVARDGLLWLTLLRVYLELRRRPAASAGEPRPTLCFNYARDESTVRREYARTHDLLFAREALTARIVHGEQFYRELLGSAVWMAGQLPVLYARRGARPSTSRAPRASAPIRLVNGLAFLLLASYFQLAGLVRNARLRRAHRTRALFRTQTWPGGLSFDSVKFEAIRARYPASKRTEP